MVYSVCINLITQIFTDGRSVIETDLKAEQVSVVSIKIRTVCVLGVKIY